MLFILDENGGEKISMKTSNVSKLQILFSKGQSKSAAFVSALKFYSCFWSFGYNNNNFIAIIPYTGHRTFFLATKSTGKEERLEDEEDYIHQIIISVPVECYLLQCIFSFASLFLS